MSKQGGSGGPSAAAGSAKALVKGLAIVDLVSDGPDAVRLPSVVEATGLPRPTVVRLLDALVGHGLLTVDGMACYRLGPRAAVWGQRYLGRLDVRTMADGILADLSERTQETCYLGVRDERWVLYVAKSESPHPVRLAAQIGSRNPLHCTGLGKTLLAYAGDRVIDEYVSWPLEVRTPRTITDPEALRSELARIRGRGYSLDHVENEDGVSCVAVPVRDHAGAVTAAISLAAPTYRLDVERLETMAPTVLAAAAAVSARLGYEAPAGSTSARGA